MADERKENEEDNQPAANGRSGPNPVHMAPANRPFDASPLLRSSEWVWNSSSKSNSLTTLTSTSLILSVGSRVSEVLLDDVIGVERDGVKLTIHSYPIESGCCTSASTPNTRSHVTTQLTPVNGTPDAASFAAEWQSQIQSLLDAAWLRGATRDPDDTRARSMLILINPASGAGNAAANLNALTPMMKQSGIHYRIQKTTHANHAFELMRDLRLESPDLPTDVICVSGDGLVHEVVNGIMQRPDWSAALRRLRIGHIGGGSGNGLASAICAQAGEKIDILTSMWLILKGHTRPMDLFTVSQPGEPIRFGFLAISYGMISDIDLESESFRCLGNARFLVAALQRICCLRRYDATMEFLVDDDQDIDFESGSGADPKSKCNPTLDGCADCGVPHGEVATGPAVVGAMQDAGRSDLARYLQGQQQSAELESIAIVGENAPATARPASSRWQVLDDCFTLVWCMNVSHAASDMHVAPGAHFSNGCLDVYFIRSIGKCSAVSLFLDMEHGRHGQNNDVTNMKVRGIRLKPTAARRSEIVVDGERMPYKPVEIRAFRGVINLLAK